MVYQVELSPTALADLDNLYEWIEKQSPDRASEWLEGCYQAILTLEQFPERCPVAVESEALGIEIRQLLYKRTVRILFTIGAEAQGNGVVRIHRVRRAAQQRLRTQEELDRETLDNEYD
jgi:plasmid stabilization system protein ParE